MEPVELSPVETDKPQVTIVVEDVTKPTTTATTKTQIKEEKTKVEKTKVIRKKVSLLCLAYRLQSTMMPNSVYFRRLTLSPSLIKASGFIFT